MSKSVIIDNLINDQLYGFRIFPRNLKGQYQTEIDGATATATPKAFSLPTYTGQYTIFGNETEGRIEMYTSGTLTLSAGTYDMFAVGGGGGSYVSVGGSGGGGGYTQTALNQNINSTNTLNIAIGSGSPPSTHAGTTASSTTIGLYITALGGVSGSGEISNRGNGGSGGGGGVYTSGKQAGAGGSDGSNGLSSSDGDLGGKGQGTTTRAFGESSGTLYAGGGAGGVSSGSGNVGGAGGGGNTGQNGTPNTGGGGGGARAGVTASGGSGIAIIRWKNN